MLLNINGDELNLIKSTATVAVCEAAAVFVCQHANTVIMHKIMHPNKNRINAGWIRNEPAIFDTERENDLELC